LRINTAFFPVRISRSQVGASIAITPKYAKSVGNQPVKVKQENITKGMTKLPTKAIISKTIGYRFSYCGSTEFVMPMYQKLQNFNDRIKHQTYLA
jgi:hypothetical protein